MIPALLKSILLILWEDRQDWLFAITYWRDRTKNVGKSCKIQR
jgi:hypothetical protein